MTGQISRAPVRYTVPPPPNDRSSLKEESVPVLAGNTEPMLEYEESQDATEAQPRSTRPGQAGFAERLLYKYGWSKGSGLGAQGTGIINSLYVKVDKRKKKSDADGGGFATPASMGKILGGTKSKQARAAEIENDKFGALSEVIKLEGMLRGLDLESEMIGGTSDDSGGIMQEIGEECSQKYGAVERVYIYRPESRAFENDEAEEAVVFVSFTSQISALRAVNALEGRVFNGNPITARYWPKDKFEAGTYA